jgi:hypothetical protein
MSKSKHITGYFNHDLYRSIREARKVAGLEVASLNVKIEDHSLIGKKLYSRESYKEYTVVSVHNHWYNGWYEVLLIEDNKKSSRLVMWTNINCKEEIILKAIDENRIELFYINEKGMYIKSF